MNATILLIEDNSALAQILTMNFEEAGHEVFHAPNLAEARVLIVDTQPDLVILDQVLPDGKGYDFLCTLEQENVDSVIIMMTAEHDLDLAITAIQAGAFDFVHKPIKTEELNLSVQRALEHHQLQRQVKELSTTANGTRQLPKLLGQSEAMLKISKEIALISTSSSRVMIRGESGTGKELVARAIHNYSGRSGPFLAINCASLVEDLLESELFGHEKGSFTGADSRKPGKFELAANGTLFLDEIAEMPLPQQAKLLRVLQEGTFERVGGSQVLESNARIVAATNRDLETAIQQGTFRGDLFYRLNTIELKLPALRDRREDIPMLIDGLLESICQNEALPQVSLTSGARTLAQQYDWPGNIRELENTLVQAVIRGRGTRISEQQLNLPQNSGTDYARIQATTSDGCPVSLEEVEAAHIQFVLDYCSGHKGRSCDILGISRPALDRKIERYSLLVHKT